LVYYDEIFKRGFFKLVSKIFGLLSIGKTLLNTKRRFSSRGVLFKSKEKHLKQGEKISNLENASCNLIHTPLTICKRTLKRFSKRNCKNKTSGASVVQNVKKKESLYICFGLCWHQSPKRGRLKGK
jgi:hypothetical protein